MPTTELTRENARLRRLLADAELEKASLREKVSTLAGAPQRRARSRVSGATPFPSGLRDVKKERLRRRIEEVALTLFVQHGFDATTVEEIATAADVSVRTFFRYFPAKEDVLLVVMDEVQHEMLAAVREGYDGSAGSLLAALTEFADGLDRRRAALLRSSRLLGHPSLYPGRLRHSRGFEDALSVVIAEHHGSPEPTPGHRRLAALSAAAMSISMRIWLEGGGRGPFREVFAVSLASLRELGAATGELSLAP